MTDMMLIYQKALQVLSPEEVNLLRQDRALLSYIISTEFVGEYALSEYDVENRLIDKGFSCEVSAHNSGEVVIKASYGGQHT